MPHVPVKTIRKSRVMMLPGTRMKAMSLGERNRAASRMAVGRSVALRSRSASRAET